MQLNNKLNRNNGFTILELLIVIAIIGILSAVVLAALSSARTNAQDVAIKTTLSNTRTQAELYRTNNSNYGTGYTSLIVANNPNGVDITPTMTTTPCDTSYATNGGIFTSSGTGGLDIIIKDMCVKGATAITASVDLPTATKWALKATSINPSTYYCVDSTNVSNTYTTDPTLANAKCP